MPGTVLGPDIVQEIRLDIVSALMQFIVVQWHLLKSGILWHITKHPLN